MTPTYVFTISKQEFAQINQWSNTYNPNDWAWNTIERPFDDQDTIRLVFGRHLLGDAFHWYIDIAPFGDPDLSYTASQLRCRLHNNIETRLLLQDGTARVVRIEVH